MATEQSTIETKPLSDAELAELQAALKRCSPDTFVAAREFRQTGDVAQLDKVVHGVVERYVERELRPKLRRGDSSIRLVEDLGLDSLSLMEIVVLAEDVLRISVTNEELTGLKTIGDLNRFVVAKVSTR